TEQWVHTVRRISALPAAREAPAGAAASAAPMKLYGSWVASTPAPTPRPERLRKARRSMVWPSARAAAPRRRRVPVVAVADFRVNMLASSSDPRRAVVIAHVRADALVGGFAACVLDHLGGHRRGVRRGRGQCGGAGGTTGTDRSQKVAARQLGV